uniref:Bestrophin homolog n=1 Tax=Panagrolaimus sp. JU765 TaxID=591449 RepID=A0AC34RLI1_9BILA
MFGDSFELFVIHCDTYVSAARHSLSFVLGFYVSIVASRWWSTFMRLPWPDTICLYISAFLTSRGERYRKEEKIQRRTVVRYLVLSCVMVFRNISERIRKRFPDLDYLKDSLLTAQELELIKKVEKNERTCVYWLPLMWVMKIFKKCYEEYRTLDEVHFVTLNQEIRNYRDCLNDLLSADWVCIPLFVFYLGWLKVAQVTLNPFGVDDDDFEVDYLIERNLKIGYAMTDELFDLAPELVEVNLANQLPHTKASAKNCRRVNPMIGSVANLPVNRRDAQMVPPHDIFRHPEYSISMPRMEEKEFEEKLLDKLPPSTAPNSSNIKAMMKSEMPKCSEQIVEQTQTPSQAPEITGVAKPDKKEMKSNDDGKPLKEVTAQFSNEINPPKPVPTPAPTPTPTPTGGTPKVKAVTPKKKSCENTRDPKEAKSGDKTKEVKIKESPRHPPNPKEAKSGDKTKEVKIKDSPRHPPSPKEKTEIEKNPVVVVQEKKKESAGTPKKEESKKDAKESKKDAKESKKDAKESKKDQKKVEEKVEAKKMEEVKKSDEKKEEKVEDKKMEKVAEKLEELKLERKSDQTLHQETQITRIQAFSLTEKTQDIKPNASKPNSLKDL